MSNQFFQYSFNRNNNQSVTNIAELDRIQKVGLIKTLKLLRSDHGRYDVEPLFMQSYLYPDIYDMSLAAQHQIERCEYR